MNIAVNLANFRSCYKSSPRAQHCLSFSISLPCANFWRSIWLEMITVSYISCHRVEVGEFLSCKVTRTVSHKIQAGLVRYAPGGHLGRGAALWRRVYYVFSSLLVVLSVLYSSYRTTTLQLPGDGGHVTSGTWHILSHLHRVGRTTFNLPNERYRVNRNSQRHSCRLHWW